MSKKLEGVHLGVTSFGTPVIYTESSNPNIARSKKPIDEHEFQCCMLDYLRAHGNVELSAVDGSEVCVISLTVKKSAP